MITWSRYISDGSFTLSHALIVAILDYQRAFGREPKRIVVPYFRHDEMDCRLLTNWNTKDGPFFRGIVFRFSIISDYIELCGTP